MSRRRAKWLAGLALLLAGPAAAQAPIVGGTLRPFLQQRYAEARENFPDSTYVHAFADLNGDGRNEALVYLQSGYFCGSGGCSLHIFTPAGGTWRELAEITIANLPIRLLNTRTSGWRDLGVIVRGGGIARPYEARLRFNSGSYASNPSTAGAAGRGSRGQVLIAPGAEGRPLF